MFNWICFLLPVLRERIFIQVWIVDLDGNKNLPLYRYQYRSNGEATQHSP